MSPKEIVIMRKQQFLMLNLGIICVILFVVGLTWMEVPFTYFMFFVSILNLIQGFRLLLKRSSTKSWIPLLEKIRAYEQEKLGKEHTKLNTINAILQFLTGVIFFWLGILYWGTGEVMERNMLLFVIGLTVFMTIIVNIGQLIHIRKVDKDSVSNIKGYAWRSFVISIVVSIGIVHLIIMTTIFYVLK